MGMVNTQFCVIGVGSLDRYLRRFLCEAMSGTFFTSLVRSNKRGAHNLLKPQVCILEVQGKGYYDTPEYIKVEIRL